jgi:hypothetical protein
MAMQKVQEKTNTLEMYTKVLFMMRSSWSWLTQQFHTCCYKFVVNNTDHVLTNSVFFLVILSSHLVLPTASDHSFLTTADGAIAQIIKSQEPFDIYCCFLWGLTFLIPVYSIYVVAW